MSAKVLVIDDEEDYRLIIRDIMSSAGFEVSSCADGQQGLEALAKQRPDLLIVDWMMPKMDGEAFCRAVRADEKFSDLPILMLTVRQTTEEELEALHFGVDDFLPKPFKSQELLARVRAVLRRIGPASPGR
jgi:DNA-binding response OmpR family regulator